VAQGQLNYYLALQEAGIGCPIRTQTELDAHMAAWQAWESDPLRAQPALGFVISMESADPILKPDQVSAWKECGVRIIGPAHYGEGRYAGGTASEMGLLSEGKILLREMEKLGIILDLTHLSDEAFWEALDIFNGVVIASHNNCRVLVPHQRQFSNEQIHAIVDRDGVIGAAFDNWMIRPGWKRGAKDNPEVTLAHVVEHIDHICQLAGDSRHAAIGSDLDGGFGREQSPSDLDTIADLQHIAEILSKRGYRDADITAIMCGNWLWLLRKAWSNQSSG
jgi:membrane dipeptidase